jgi:tetratricopeptide (TPR) repeat protein
MHLYPQAIELYSKAHQLAPVAIEIVVQWTECFVACHQYDLAIRQAHSLIDRLVSVAHLSVQQDMEIRRALYNILGWSNHCGGNSSLGLMYLNRACTTHPLHAELRRNRAEVLRFLQHYDLALKDAEYAVAKIPNDPLAHLHYANVLRDLRRMEGALVQYEYVLATTESLEMIETCRKEIQAIKASSFSTNDFTAQDSMTIPKRLYNELRESWMKLRRQQFHDKKRKLDNSEEEEDLHPMKEEDFHPMIEGPIIKLARKFIKKRYTGRRWCWDESKQIWRRATAPAMAVLLPQLERLRMPNPLKPQHAMQYTEEAPPKKSITKDDDWDALDD